MARRQHPRYDTEVLGYGKALRNYFVDKNKKGVISLFDAVEVLGIDNGTVLEAVTWMCIVYGAQATIWWNNETHDMHIKLESEKGFE